MILRVWSLLSRSSIRFCAYEICVLLLDLVASSSSLLTSASSRLISSSLGCALIHIWKCSAAMLATSGEVSEQKLVSTQRNEDEQVKRASSSCLSRASLCSSFFFSASVSALAL